VGGERCCARGGPRAARGWLVEACGAVTRGFVFPRSRRLLKPADFAAAHKPSTHGEQFRIGGRYLALVATGSSGETTTLRFGVTVGKRNAPRAVERVLVRRVLREAARNAAPALLAAEVIPVGERGTCRRCEVVVLRLKAPLPRAEFESRSAIKRRLRAEADALLERLILHFSTRTPPLSDQ